MDFPQIDFLQIDNGDISLRVAVQGQGPVILCVHGWPELWYSQNTFEI